MKWILSPIATLKRKLILLVIKRAIKRLRKVMKSEIVWLANKLDKISDALQAFANGDINEKQVLDHVTDLYDSGEKLLTKVKK